MVRSSLITLVRLLCILVISTLSLAACTRADAHDSEGKSITMTDYRGKWVVINYWATWCKPCLIELPELERLHQEHNTQLAVLGVSFDTLDDESIQRVKQSLGLTFPLLATFPREKWGVTEISSLPVTLLISPQGHLVKTLYGPQTQQTLLAEMHS